MMTFRLHWREKRRLWLNGQLTRDYCSVYDLCKALEVHGYGYRHKCSGVPVYFGCMAIDVSYEAAKVLFKENPFRTY